MFMEDCKKCPKCNNGNLVFNTVGDWKQYYVIECPKCGYIAAESHEARITIPGAIKVWNKR